MESSHELIELMVKNTRHTVKLLKPRNGTCNLSNIFEAYAITNKEEEAIFVKKLHLIQQKVNRMLQTGKLSFERMDDAANYEFVMSVVQRFRKQMPVFSSMSRDRREAVLARGTNKAGDCIIPPVGYYRPNHVVVDKKKP